MHIESLEIRNVKGFEDVRLDLRREDGSLAGWTVLAGRNGSGKSTLLKCLALALRGPEHSHRLEPSMRNWVRRGAEDGKIELRIRFDSASDKLSGSDSESTAIIGLKLRREGDWTKLEPIGPDFGENGPWGAGAGTGWLLTGYGPHRSLSSYAADPGDQRDAPPAVQSVASLFREHALLADSQQWLREVHYRELEAKDLDQTPAPLLADALALLSDGLLPDGVIAERVDSEGLWVKQRGHTVLLEETSDGYRSIAAMITDLLHQIKVAFPGRRLCDLKDGRPTVRCSGIVLIDEAENHLHPAWEQRLGVWLKNHFPGIQFLVTTHSVFVCQAADSRGLIRLPGLEDEGGPEHVSKDIYYTVVHGGADDAVVSHLFGLLMPHSDEAEKLREELARLEARVLRGQITEDEKQTLERLRARMPPGPGPEVSQVLRALRY